MDCQGQDGTCKCSEAGQAEKTLVVGPDEKLVIAIDGMHDGERERVQKGIADRLAFLGLTDQSLVLFGGEDVSISIGKVAR